MGREPFKLEIRVGDDSLRNFERAHGRSAKPAHSGVELEVDLLPLPLPPGFLRDPRHHPGGVDRRRDVVGDDPADFFLDDGAQDQDRRKDACLAEFEGLGRIADADHRGAGLDRDAGAGRRAMPVRVRLHDRQQRHIRPRVGPDDADVFGEGVEVDLGPDAVFLHRREKIGVRQA
ncbi:MAG: hypothetical protein FD180_3098 [Planctomycetota bacterium]|nr:MAG: hypothetical protein FD180_3098 [Planctomycetota bacterium]